LPTGVSQLLQVLVPGVSVGSMVASSGTKTTTFSMGFFPAGS
jgi:hypothetical protein